MAVSPPPAPGSLGGSAPSSQLESPGAQLTCLQQPRVTGVLAPNVVKPRDYNSTSYGVSVWGGFCTCPDGQLYAVGDNEDACASLACVGGVSSTCHREEGPWDGRKVTCATAETGIRLQVHEGTSDGYGYGPALAFTDGFGSGGTFSWTHPICLPAAVSSGMTLCFSIQPIQPSDGERAWSDGCAATQLADMPAGEQTLALKGAAELTFRLDQLIWPPQPPSLSPPH